MTRSTRILGMMLLFGLFTAFLAGRWKYAGPATLVAIITGGFVGQAWHHWRRAEPLSFKEFSLIRQDGVRDGLEQAARLVEDCAEISESRDQALRHASLIRKLKPLTILESPVRRG